MSGGMEAASADFAAGKYQQAIEFCVRQLTEDPHDTEVLRLLGLAYLSLGEVELGVGALEEATLTGPLDADARIELAIAYGELGKDKLSCDLLMGIATTGKNSVDQMLRIAAGLESIDRPRLAMEACRRAGTEDPEYAEVHYRMGCYAQRCGFPEGTIEALIRRAVDLEPKNVHYRVGLASLLIRLGRKAEAVLLMEPSIPFRLNEIHCKCCLKRIANLFFDFDRLDLSKQCAQRLGELIRNEENASLANVPHEFS